MQNYRPREGERKVSWSHHKVPTSKSGYEGYKAGPLVCAKSHTIGGSKPCLLVYTGGKVRCRCQDSPARTEWIGWLPFWDSYEAGRFLTVRENMFDRIDKIDTGVRFVFNRGEEKRATVWCRQGETFTRCPFKQLMLHSPVDFMPFLQETLWGMPFLAEFAHVPPAGALPPEKAVSLKRLTKPVDDAEVAERERLKNAQQKPASELTADDALLAGRTVDFVMGNAAELAHRRNGHLPKKG